MIFDLRVWPSFKKCGIASQLTPPGTPQRNGASERRNHTLLDMVHSMLSVTDNFSACREHLTENRLSFPSTPRWVRHSYLS